MVVVPTLNGASEPFRVQLPKLSQVYSGLPSLRKPTTVTLSPVAVAVPTVIAAAQVASAVPVWFAGHEITGGFVPVSVTVMVKLQLPPPVSEVEVTVVVPTGKNEPEAGVVVTVPQVPASETVVSGKLT
jgi:hypothetical protein